MAERSIESCIQFDSYKVDKIDFTVEPNLATLKSRGNDYDVNYQFGFRDALKFSNAADKVLYVTGISVEVTLNSKTDKHEMAKGLFVLTGLFVGIGLDEKQEAALATTQGPALLFPYARAIISQTFYNSGFEIPVMPLLNVNEMAKNSGVKIIER